VGLAGRGAGGQGMAVWGLVGSVRLGFSGSVRREIRPETHASLVGRGASGRGLGLGRDMSPDGFICRRVCSLFFSRGFPTVSGARRWLGSGLGSKSVVGVGICSLFL
jgi:hypothetical protein